MYQRLTASALGLGLLVLTATAQQPLQPPAKANEVGSQPPPPPQPGAPGARPPQAPPAKPGDPAPVNQPGASKKGDPTDALVKAALANDPDMKLAQAKIQLAEAELAKAKQAVVLKVMTLNSTVQELKNQIDALNESTAQAKRMVDSGVAPLSTLTDDRMKLEHAKSSLARAELELKLIAGNTQKEVGIEWFTPNMPVNPNTQPYWSQGQNFAQWYNNPANHGGSNFYQTAPFVAPPQQNSAKGPIPERIRAALDKVVKLAPKGEQVTFVQAMEIFKKEAGLDAPLRNNYAGLNPILSEGEELPVGSWFQMFADFNKGTKLQPSEARFLVREYGLLITTKELAPPDALTVTEFWKMPLKKNANTSEKKDAILRKYSVPTGTAEAIAKTLQLHEPAIRVMALLETNEILVFGTETEQAAIAKQIKEVGGDKTPDAKSKSQSEPAKK